MIVLMSKLHPVFFKGMNGLPNAIDVEKFVEVIVTSSSAIFALWLILVLFVLRPEPSRSAPCKRLSRPQGETLVVPCALSEHCLTFCLYSLFSESGTQRAWQALPRHLRRRAASHDVRRVPLRLREKARAEVSLFLPLLMRSLSYNHALSRWILFGKKHLVARCLSEARTNG
jgi:hypothetical protein